MKKNKKIKQIVSLILLSFIALGLSYITMNKAEKEDETIDKKVWETKNDILLDSNMKIIFMYREITLSMPILVKENTEYFPLINLIDNLGGNYTTDADGQIIHITFLRNEAKISAYMNTFIVNDKTIELRKPALFYLEEMYVPVEAIETALGLEIEFDKEKRTFHFNMDIDSSVLDTKLAEYGDSVSIYYQNLITGYTYRYNAEQVYFAASVIKAPYCMYVYQLAEAGKIDLTSTFSYSSANFQSDAFVNGTGVLKKRDSGVFTGQELLTYSIIDSDNIALQMLINKYGIADFKKLVSNLGGNTNLIRNVQSANMTATEAGIFARAIYEYIESDSPYSKQFKKDLMSTRNAMIKADFPIARKYGWADASFHDMAIVYSSSPYILVIMSARDEGTKEDYEAFKDISKAFQKFNESNFVE